MGTSQDGIILLHPLPRSAQRSSLVQPAGSSSPEPERDQIGGWRPGSRGGRSEDGHGPLSLVVRSVRVKDLAAIARTPVVARLNQPEIALHRYSPTGSAIRALTPGRKGRPRVFVAGAGDRYVG